MTTTIYGLHNGSITISSAAYPSPVYVTRNATVHGSTGTSAVDMVTSGASLQNAGYIHGGSSGTGGGGVDMSAAGSITNTGTITGGAGAQDGFGIKAVDATIVNYGTISAGAATSRDGVDLGAGSTLSNYHPTNRSLDATIRGGSSYSGKPGGIGVSIAAGATLHNGDFIRGGNGFGGSGLNAGGVGVYLAAGGTLTNNLYGAIVGGLGGDFYGGGDGVVLAAGASFTNGGQIYGGTTDDYRHRAGAGVYLHAGASLTNDRFILGGADHPDSPYTSFGGGDGVDLAANAQLINNDGIAGGGEHGNNVVSYTTGIGVSLAAGATVTNSATGSIFGGYGFYISNGARVANGTGSAGGYVGSNAVLVNLAQGAYVAGQLHASLNFLAGQGIFGGNAVVGGAGVVLNGGTLVNAGLIVGGYNGYQATQANSTNRADAVQFGSAAGTLVVESGFDFIGNVVAVSGVADVLEVSGTSTAALSGIGTQFQNFADITFAGGAAWTIAGNSAGLTGGTTISGFAHADTIDLTDFAATAKNYVAGTGLVLSDGSQSVTLDITGSFKTSDFSIAGDGGSGTLIEDTTPCYRRGTLIEAARGQQKVETLNIGDKVRTASGVLRPIKWIGRRSYNGRFVMGRTDILPVCIKSGALADNVPARDLWVSPNHAMYFSSPDGAERNPGTPLQLQCRSRISLRSIRAAGLLIEAKDLINGVSIVQAERAETLEYFHIELETHDVIIAEGALSETFIDDDSRGLFHNAHDYDTLYAGEVAQPACYCAPRLDEGYEVEAVRQRLALRAGLLGAADGPRVGGLRGYIDRIRATGIAGWAQNIDAPEAPVCLDIVADGKLIGRVLANAYREDLKYAGLGSGRHAFTFTPPAGLALRPDAVEVRRSLDGVALEFGAGSRRAPQRVAAKRLPNVSVHRRAASG